MTHTLMPWRNRWLRPADALDRDMGNLFVRFFGEEPFLEGHEQFRPSTNIAETDTGYEVTVDLPGMKAEDVNIELQEGTLTISGKSEAEEEEGKTFHRIERRTGEFRRTIGLPAPVDEAAIEAEFKDGVLQIVLPKSPEVRPRQIKVKK